MKKKPLLILLGLYIVLEAVGSILYSTAQDPLSTLGRIGRISIGIYLMLFGAGRV